MPRIAKENGNRRARKFQIARTEILRIGVFRYIIKSAIAASICAIAAVAIDCGYESVGRGILSVAANESLR